MANTNRGFNRQKQNRQIKVKEQKKADPLKESAQPESKTSKWSVDNWISFWGLVFNILVAVVTILLFMQTRVSNQIATRGIENAESANRLSMENLELLKKSMADADNLNQANLELTKQSVKAQENSISIAKSQFNQDNVSFLDIRGFEAGNMVSGEKLSIICKIFNGGKAPAKITSARLGCWIGPINNNTFVNKIIDNLKEDKSISMAEISNLYPAVITMTNSNIMTQAELDSIANRTSNISLYGQIKYTNVTTTKKKIFRFYIVIMDPAMMTYTVMFATNNEEK